MPLFLFIGSVLSAVYAAVVQFALLIPTYLFYLASRLTAKTVILLSYVGGTIALYYAFSASVEFLVSALSTSVPSVFGVFEMFLPSNTSLCIYCCLMTRLYSIVYVWWRHLYSKYLSTYTQA